jgi:GT2 family glycosyltransferase
MTTSAIIATKNRPAELAEMLHSLLGQSRLPDEVVIVDQSENDGARSVVQSFATSGRQHSPQLVYCYEPTAAGASAARNIGIDQSRGDVLMFFDDDVTLERDYVEQILATYERDAGLGGVSGVVINYPRPSLAQRFTRRLFWIGPFHDERQPIYWNANRLRAVDAIPVRKFGSGVMSLRRSVLKHHRFDANLKGVPPGEDVDLCCRLGSGCRLVITPKARLVHKRTVTNRAAEHWLKLDALANYYLYLRNWRHGVKNRLCFAWLNCGYTVLVFAGVARRRSLQPWRAVRRGIRQAQEAASHSGVRSQQFELSVDDSR